MSSNVKDMDTVATVIGNGYINCNLQKAFVPGIPGCHEHQFKVWRALQDAKACQRSLCAVWLDLKNAYGSICPPSANPACNVSVPCFRKVSKNTPT